MKKFVFLKLLLISLWINAQQVIITDDPNYTSTNSSTLLEIHSKNGNMGILIPRVTLQSETDNTTVSNPVDGLLVFHDGSSGPRKGFYFWSSSDNKWELLYSGNVPSIPGNTEFWIRPDGEKYIRPEYNGNARVYDSGQNWTFYYEGSNKHGAFFAGSDVGIIGQRAGTDTSYVPQYISDQFPFNDTNGDASITQDDEVTYTGVYAYGNYFVGITGIATWDAGLRGIGLDKRYGTNSRWPVVGVIGEVIYDGGWNYGQQAVYGWQAAPPGDGDYCQGVTGRTSQTGAQSAGVGGYYTNTLGDLTTNFSDPITYGLLGTSFTGVYGYSKNYYYWAGYFDGDVYIDGTLYGRKKDNNTIFFYSKSKQNIIEDFGHGQLTKGKTKINIPTELIDKGKKLSSADYYVFIQMNDPNANGVYVEKHSTYFIVHENNNGKSNSEFDWRIVIKKESQGLHNKKLIKTEDMFIQKNKKPSRQKIENKK